MEIPLRLGPLKAAGYKIHRSGVRWLCEPGQLCRANQPIAFLNLVLEPDGASATRPKPFAEERELQVVCAPRLAGRVHYDPAATPGGYLSVLGIHLWQADTVIARLEVADASADSSVEPALLRLLLLAGRRMTPLVDVHSGLLPGWNNRSRAWWCEAGELPVTLLSLGICDVTGLILGEQCAFLDMFEAEPAPSHFAFLPDHPVAPAAPILLDQLKRTPGEFQAIASDLYAGLSRTGLVPTADDLMFAGALLGALEQCPIRDTYDLISASGHWRSEPAEALLLSLSAEPPSLLRHKSLGYHLHLLQHHRAAAGPAFKKWLGAAFQPVSRGTSDIKRDYEKLLAAIRESTNARVIILNRMSTSGDEEIATYAPFDAPLSATLGNIAAKELNVMLLDLAEDPQVAILDVDAIAAEIGGREHLPDGIHQSKEMQQLLREEILTLLDDLRPAC
jgi:hypothetical protein